MKSRWGKKRTSKNLFIRPAKRNWFENRSCLCSTGNVLIFTSPSTLGSDSLDPSVTKGLRAFMLNFLSQALTQLNQGNTVSPSSCVWPPNRECNSSRCTGGLTLHRWSCGLKYLLFHPIKSKCSWPFELRILLLKIQMLIYQCWKSKKQWLPYVCPDFFPVSQMEMQMLCYVCRVLRLQSQPAKSKKDIFQVCRNPNTFKSIGACCHKMHMCLPICPDWSRATALPGLLAVWKAGQVSTRPERKWTTCEKCNLWAKDKMWHVRPREGILVSF